MCCSGADELSIGKSASLDAQVECAQKGTDIAPMLDYVINSWGIIE